ncbi:MAG: hypothetical protein F2563_01515 [Actinobacteria bacterium]|uniref:Unannotated protein n=1 Tax=freshwater metagenome TaxID=449393 RepID=A0A6J6E623_9ZZZZ|nr:hypothetical protein [Actinomycetota bacterium]
MEHLELAKNPYDFARILWGYYESVFEHPDFAWDSICLGPIIDDINVLYQGDIRVDLPEILFVLWTVYVGWVERKESTPIWVDEMVDRSIEQRTDEWYSARSGTLNGSTFHKIVGTAADWDTMLIEKVDPPTSRFGAASCDWGVKYEPVAKRVYEMITGTTVTDIGFLLHNDYHVGASPDGLCFIDGRPRLIEFKCKYSKAITDTILYDYWVQMQVQMEVCDVNECDFVEVKFVEYPHPTTGKYWGVRVDGTTNSTTDPYRTMMSPVNPDDVRGFVKRATEFIESEHGGVVTSVKFWVMEEIDICVVPRNKMWWRAAVPNIHEFWEQFNVYKERGVAELQAKKRKKPRVAPGVLLIKEEDN